MDDAQGQGGQTGDAGRRRRRGEGAGGTIVVTAGQLGQIWESRNLSLRKDDPTLSFSLFDRLVQNSVEPVGWKFLNFSNPGDDVKGLE